jgi:hypothetical protein
VVAVVLVALVAEAVFVVEMLELDLGHEVDLDLIQFVMDFVVPI